MRSELGSILAQWRASRATENIHINLAGQRANSLLHDGHAWKDFARTALSATRRAIRSARTDGAQMLVRASFAFVHAVERGARLKEPLRSPVDLDWRSAAALRYEDMAMRHVPNALTLLRFLLIPVLVVLLAQRDYATAFAAFFISALSDFADGVIARRWNARTRLGAIADPLADKLTMLTVTLTLAVQGLLPLWLVAAIVVRDLVIVGGALAYHYTVGRYDVAPTHLSKLNTAIEFLTLAMVLGNAADIVSASAAMPTLFALLMATIVASGAQYVWVWGRRAIRHHAGRNPSAEK